MNKRDHLCIAVCMCVVLTLVGAEASDGTEKFVVSNHPPTVASVAITPDPAYTTDDLTATPSGWYDEDGDPEGYDWQWEKDSSGEKFTVNNFVVIVGANADTLGSANFVRGDVVRVTCTPNDGDDTGAPVTDQVTVGNAAPTVPTVVVTPANPTTSDSLRATASGSTDADGDPITYSYQWHRNGISQPGRIYRTLAAQWTRPGQQWHCVVTPNDGAADGPAGEDTVTINTPPPTPVIEITPAVPNASDGLLCSVTNKDADGDTITHSYQWYRDGEIQVGVCWPRIGSWRTRANQEWTCVVTSSDGIEDGPSATDSVHIGQAVTAPTVVINPGNPSSQNSFRVVASGSVCADGSDPVYSYTWYKNGALQVGLTWQRIGAWRTRPGQVWRCVARATDGVNTSPAGEASVTIGDKSAGPLTVSSLACVPTARGAEVAFTLSADAAVTCEVLNIAGRPVKTIVADRSMAAGINSLAWDGRNAAGLRAPAGMYLVRMTATAAGGARWTSMRTLSLTR